MKQVNRRTLIAGAMFLALQSCAQQADTVQVKDEAKNDSLIAISWQQLAAGIDYCETDAPFKSVLNDSRLTILRIDPEKVTFEMYCASEMDKQARTADVWADKFELNIVFNAGMYDLTRKLTSRGYLKNYDHVNQGTVHPAFNSMFAFHPVDTTKSPYDIIDLECWSWDQVKKTYASYAQGLRMLDCDGKPMNWSKRKQSCSMLVAAKDEQGRLVLVFTRSPYLHNDMIRFLQLFPMKLTHAIYMEGGPETSLYVNVGETKIEKVGSYVSQTYENDLNDHYWKLPNVIGIKLKEK